jgi:SOS-response transcriptional repressor LexA
MSNTIGTVKSNISRYERDLIHPTIGFIELLLKHYRVNLNWLFGEPNEEMFMPQKESIRLKQVPKKEFIDKKRNLEKVIVLPHLEYTQFGIPIYSDSWDVQNDEQQLLPIAGDIAAGEPLPITDTEHYDFVPLPVYKSVSDIDNYLVFKVNGQSMEPDIRHGDVVFILKSNHWLELNKKIVAVNIHGEMTLKKLIIEPETQEVIFRALNRDFCDIKIEFEMMESTLLVGELKSIRRINN